MMFAMTMGIDMAANLSVVVNVPIEQDNSSNDILDTKSSSRYRITLEEARRRALRSIKKAREIVWIG